jgi:hypothetical protein
MTLHSVPAWSRGVGTHWPQQIRAVISLQLVCGSLQRALARPPAGLPSVVDAAGQSTVRGRLASLAIFVWCLTVAKVDSIGMVVRRWNRRTG